MSPDTCKGSSRLLTPESKVVTLRISATSASRSKRERSRSARQRPQNAFSNKTWRPHDAVTHDPAQSRAGRLFFGGSCQHRFTRTRRRGARLLEQALDSAHAIRARPVDPVGVVRDQVWRYWCSGCAGGPFHDTRIIKKLPGQYDRVPTDVVRQSLRPYPFSIRKLAAAVRRRTAVPTPRKATVLFEWGSSLQIGRKRFAIARTVFRPQFLRQGIVVTEAALSSTQ